MQSKNAKPVTERRRAISEAFHSLHQPLTSLHCGLEITLLKQRKASEYRERVQEALVHANAVLRLNKILRERVEATDPGERFGRVSARPVLARVVEDVLVVAEPARVAISAREVPDVIVAADPLKLSRVLGQVMASLVSDMAPGSSLKVTAQADTKALHLRLTSDGKRREPRDDNNIETKIQAIGLDAAHAYVQTLSGEFHIIKPGVVDVKLPLAK